MKHKLFNLLLVIPLLTTFYLADGSYIWSDRRDWYYWYLGRFDYPIGVTLKHDGTIWNIPFGQITKIVED